jgi:hypothetical protein
MHVTLYFHKILSGSRNYRIFQVCANIKKVTDKGIYSNSKLVYKYRVFCHELIFQITFKLL